MVATPAFDPIVSIPGYETQCLGKHWKSDQMEKARMQSRKQNKKFSPSTSIRGAVSFDRSILIFPLPFSQDGKIDGSNFPASHARIGGGKRRTKKIL